MITKFKTKGYTWGKLIEKVECIRETEKSVFFEKGQRALKRTDYVNYFDTWEEAKTFLLLKAESRLKSAELNYNNAKGHYGNIKGLIPSHNDEGDLDV